MTTTTTTTSPADPKLPPVPNPKEEKTPGNPNAPEPLVDISEPTDSGMNGVTDKTGGLKDDTKSDKPAQNGEAGKTDELTNPVDAVQTGDGDEPTKKDD